MEKSEPFFRESGAGPAVVCLHANAGTSGQWRALMDRLAPTHRVLAPDCYGAGKSPAWRGDRLMTLRDEVDFLEPVFARAGSSFSLVGHSYGAAVALIAALERGDSHAAAHSFIDYWMGPGSWQATPAARQAPIAESVRNIRHWAHALTTEPTPGAAFSRLHSFAGLGHMGPLTHPEVVNAILVPFLGEA